LESTGEEVFHHAGKPTDSRLGSGGDDVVAAWTVGAGTDPVVAAEAPVTKTDRTSWVAEAPFFSCPALPRLEVDEGGRSGFISEEAWDGLGGNG
jgi:hypothetical protein